MSDQTASRPVSGTPAQTQKARHFAIAELVLRHGSVSIDDLVEHTGVSVMTIYRDVATLEEAGLLQRHRGRVTAVASGLHEASAAFRAEQQRETKQAMADLIAARIPAGSSLVVDDSTSGVFVIRALGQKTPITVVTNSLLAAAETTAHPDLHLFLLGGSYQGWANALLGPTTLANLAELDADFCVISASGIAQGRCYHPYQDVVAVKRAMLDVARTKILLLDHTKMSRRALHAFARLDEFDLVVVDQDTDPAMVTQLQEWGATVEVASARGAAKTEESSAT